MKQNLGQIKHFHFFGREIDLDYVSKPVALLYKKQELTVNDVRAAMAIERHMSLIEGDGLTAKHYQHSEVEIVGLRLPTAERIKAASDQLEIWLEALKRESIPAGAVFDMLIDRKTMHAVDRRFQKTNGWSRTMLIKGLKLWTQLFFEGRD